MTAPVRLVQTGLDAQGRSTVLSDTLVYSRELPTGRVLHPLWAGDNVVGAACPPVVPGLYPSAGGLRLWVFTVRADEPPAQHSALHRTDTIDLGFVVAGVLTMHLEDGTSVDLRTGDAFVQHGTLHGWSNAGEVDATITLTVLGVAPAV